LKSESYDVAVIGGALAGASTALLLKREHPSLRIAIIERAAQFDRKVGEATVEVSAYFLARILGLREHLQNKHVSKQGLRFWFANSETKSFEESSEIGGKYLARVPSYQIDRAVLDEEVLLRAVDEGAKLFRPVRVESVTLESGGLQRVSFENGQSEISARWVVDASGPAAFLARQNKWLKPNEEHPTTAVWARWRNVKSWDSEDLAQRFPDYCSMCFGSATTRRIISRAKAGGHGRYRFMGRCQRGRRFRSATC
jgi:flavin-dependent dehydrogenase